MSFFGHGFGHHGFGHHGLHGFGHHGHHGFGFSGGFLMIVVLFIILILIGTGAVGLII